MATLRERLAEAQWLLADGATGTNLFGMGLVSGDAPEFWNVDHPDRIATLHRSFVDAGADIILTNTFGANSRRLMLHKAESRVAELNVAAARIAREVADSAGRPVVVAGSVGPTGDLLVPLGPLTIDDAKAVFLEQISALEDGGVDVIWIETMSSLDEITAAALAAVEAGMDYTVTASFDTAGRTMMGVQPAELVAMLSALPTPPLACGANCGVGASDTLAAILGMEAGKASGEGAAELAIISKANAGIPQFHGDHIHYSGTPELMGRYACLAVDSGVRIVGGCCGTAPEHLAAMRAALDAHSRGETPSIEEIVAQTGPLVAPATAPTGGDAPARGRSRRRSG